MNFCLKIKIHGFCILPGTKCWFATEGGRSYSEGVTSTFPTRPWWYWVQQVRMILYSPYWPYVLLDNTLWWTTQWPTRVAISKYPNILLYSVYQNNWHTPCLCCDHTSVYFYVKRQVMMFSLSTRHMFFDGILFVCPSTVITEFLGTQTGFFLGSNPLYEYIFFCWNFVGLILDRSSVFGVLVCLICWDMTSDVVPNVWFFCTCKWWKIHNWENSRGWTPSWHLNKSNPYVSYSLMNML